MDIKIEDEILPILRERLNKEGIIFIPKKAKDKNTLLVFRLTGLNKLEIDYYDNSVQLTDGVFNYPLNFVRPNIERKIENIVEFTTKMCTLHVESLIEALTEGQQRLERLIEEEEEYNLKSLVNFCQTGKFLE